MIIIIRALSRSGKDDGDYDSPTSREKRRKAKKEKAQIKKIKKMIEKERRGNATILLPHLCFKVAP